MYESYGARISAGVRLDINRDSEVLNQFVRINLEEPDVLENGENSILKSNTPQRPEPADIIKALGAHRTKEEKKVEFDLKPQIKKTEDEKAEEQTQEHQEPHTAEKKEQEVSDKDKLKTRLGQKQIKEELKKRRKRRKRPRPEELYTDKDRAAAVNMGSRDIKQSLRIKRKLDRSRNLQMPDEADPTTFLALGNFEMTKEEPSIALSFLNKALELDPAEKNSLVARSKCYLLLGQPENGLKDAEAALTTDKNFIKAIYQKAEALYYLGDFEHSLMYYHRGLRIRPEHEGFQLGVRKAQKAIENAIGGTFPGLKKSPAVSSSAKTSTKSGTKETATISSKTTPMKNTPEPKLSDTTPKSTKRNSPQFRPLTAVNKSSKLLRELGPDKEYLDSLLSNPSIKCKNKEDDSVIVGYIQEAVDFLNIRQEFWRQQLPASYK